MSDRPTLGTAQEATEGRWSAPQPGIEAQDVQVPERAADGRTADPDQLAALRTWLAAEVLKIRHRLPLMRVPEVWRSMDGMAQGLDYTARVIDSFAATERLPVTGGKECDCADPETQHGATAADSVPSGLVDPADSCRGPGALPYRCYCDCQGCEGGDCAAHQSLRQRTDRAEAALTERDAELAQLRAQVAAARSFADEMRGYCSWQGIAAMYADRLDKRLDAAGEAR